MFNFFFFFIGTAEFYNEKGILIVPVPFQSVDNVDENGIKCITDFLATKRFDLVINLPKRNRAGPVVSSIVTHGYRTRRSAIDYSVPLITDVKCAKLLVEVSIISNSANIRFFLNETFDFENRLYTKWTVNSRNSLLKSIVFHLIK